MPLHRHFLNDGSKRRGSTQGKSPLEILRKKAPRSGDKKHIEWKYIIYPYKDIVEEDIGWVVDRASCAACAGELLKPLQTGVILMEKVETNVEKYESSSKKPKEIEGKDKDGKDFGNYDLQQTFDIAVTNLRAMTAEVREAYHDNNPEDGVKDEFGRCTGSGQRGPEAGWLREFYEFTYKLFDEQSDSDAAKKATAALKSTRGIQKSMRDACHSRGQVAEELFQRLHEFGKKMETVKEANGDIDALHDLESDLEQID